MYRTATRLLIDAHRNHGSVGVDVTEGRQRVATVEVAQPIKHLDRPVSQACLTKILEQQGCGTRVEMEEGLIGSVRDWLTVREAVAHVDHVFYAESLLDALAILICTAIAAPGPPDASSASPVDAAASPATSAALWWAAFPPVAPKPRYPEPCGVWDCLRQQRSAASAA